MKNKDIKKYLKYLNHQVDIIENDIEESSKHIKMAYMSLKSVKSIINQLSNDVYMDDKHKETTKFVKQYDDRVTVEYETYGGEKKKLDVPLHTYEEIKYDDVIKGLTTAAKNQTELPGENSYDIITDQMKNKAFYNLVPDHGRSV